MSERQMLLIELTQRVEEFYFDHETYPNAIIVSYDHMKVLADIDRQEIKNSLSTVMCLIPTRDPLAFDLPLPVLLPTVATKLQREQAIMLENRNL